MALDLTFWAVLGAGAVIHWLLPHRFRAAFVSLLSLGYLATLDPFSTGVLAAWTVLFFYVAPRAVAPADDETGSKGGRILSLLVLAILGYLVFFKYVPPLVHALAPDATGLSLILPLGISYFTFKLVHYAVEVRQGGVTDRSFWTFCAYIYLFPIFTAGPIERFDHFLDNRETRLTREALAAGLTRIVHGLVKKFAIADLLVFDHLMEGHGIAWQLEHLHEMNAGDTWLLLFLMFAYAYFDFAAYSDLAIGSSRLFGFTIMENFDWPIKATDIGKFWKRWHMTLAGWCQAYVYMPAIGWTRNPYLGVYATFLAMGLWHAGSLNYIAWGLYHGTGVAVLFTWGQMKRKRGWKLPERGVLGLWRNAVTMVFCAGGFAFSTTNGHGIGAALRLAGSALGITPDAP